MIDPDAVRRAAEEVLSRPGYVEDVPGPVDRLLAELRSRFAEWLFDLIGSGTASNVGVVIAVVVVGVVVVLGIVALLGVRRRQAADLVVEEVDATTSGDALAAADEALAAGDLVAAVRQRYAALLLLLVERDVLAARPGTTVGEVDAAVAAAVPVCVADVQAAGRALADVVYGHRQATRGDDELVARAVHRIDREAPRAAVPV